MNSDGSVQAARANGMRLAEALRTFESLKRGQSRDLHRTAEGKTTMVVAGSSAGSIDKAANLRTAAAAANVTVEQLVAFIKQEIVAYQRPHAAKRRLWLMASPLMIPLVAMPVETPPEELLASPVGTRPAVA